MFYYSCYRPCSLSLQKERSLLRHALAVGQARIAFLVAYSPPTLKFFQLLYSSFNIPPYLFFTPFTLRPITISAASDGLVNNRSSITISSLFIVVIFLIGLFVRPNLLVFEFCFRTTGSFNIIKSARYRHNPRFKNG